MFAVHHTWKQFANTTLHFPAVSSQHTHNTDLHMEGNKGIHLYKQHTLEIAKGNSNHWHALLWHLGFHSNLYISLTILRCVKTDMHPPPLCFLTVTLV